MPLSQAFMQSIENGDWLAWSALIAMACEAVVIGAIAISVAIKVYRKEFR